MISQPKNNQLPAISECVTLSPGATVAPAGSSWKVGDCIENRWEIRAIASGGMGVVYTVFDRSSAETLAAKTFRDDVFAHSPSVADRFRQEAKAWINLGNHPNVTDAQFVEEINGKPYLFLEHVAGGDLGDWIGPRLSNDLPQALRFAIQVCDGMRHAQEKGITAHRDLKPQNCLIANDGTVKLTDFGLARVFRDTHIPRRAAPTGSGEMRWFGVGENPKRPAVESGQGQTLVLSITRSGVAAGTPAYMAPEQFDATLQMNVRADIYSFGVMLFQMVTGQLPFLGKTWNDFETLHKTQSPPALPLDNPTLNNLVHTCLAKNSWERYREFGAVRERLCHLYGSLTGEFAPRPAAFLAVKAVDWVHKGENLLKLHDLPEAMACFTMAINLHPRDARAWHGKAKALSALFKRIDALTCFERALALDPHLVAAWFDKGQCLYDAGHICRAMTCFQEAVQQGHPRAAKEVDRCRRRLAA